MEELGFECIKTTNEDKKVTRFCVNEFYFVK